VDTAVMVALVSLAGTVVVGALTYRASRSATDVKWVEQARADVGRAQQRANAAEEKAESAEARADACQERLRRMELRMVSLESREAVLAARIRYIVRMIHDPYQTIDQLRQRIPAGFGANDS